MHERLPPPHPDGDRATSPRASIPASTAAPGLDVTGHPVAAFFDLDKTIIAGSSTLAFSGPLRDRGLIGRRALLRSGYAQLLLMVSGADARFMERMRERISALCAGWRVAEIREVIEETLTEVLQPMIYAEAVALIEDHHRLGHHVVVVSASGEEMVAPVARALGADSCAATRMVVADGRYTGEIEFYCYGEGKAVAARELAARRGYRLQDCAAYSDSITDLPLLELVGQPHAVNPDKALRRLARTRGWPVLDFVAPVPLPARLGSRVRSLLPASLTPASLTPASLLPAPPLLPRLPTRAGPAAFTLAAGPADATTVHSPGRVALAGIIAAAAGGLAVLGVRWLAAARAAQQTLIDS